MQNCIACHNPKKSESKYVMTTFAQLAKGGQQGEGVTLEPGDLIATGTPSGVGPMQIGATISIEIDGIGKLQNTVVAGEEVNR